MRLLQKHRLMRDLDVRIAVRAKLHADHAEDRDTRIVEEMGVWSGSARIDLAVINGEISGFELKSARDNLRRLPAQSEIYSQIFDRVTLVTAINHLAPCLGQLPRWWGLTVARTIGSDVVLEQIRIAQRNPQPNPLQIARLLWKDEALTILQKYASVKGFKSTSISRLHAKLSDELPMETLQFEVRAVLKRRVDWLGKPVDDVRHVPVGSDL